MNLNRIIRNAAFVTVWAVALYAAAQLHRIDLGYLSFLCGRWGCLAPSSGLLGVHLMGFVMVVGVTISVIGLRLISVSTARTLLVSLGSLALLSIVGQAMYEWQPESLSEVGRLVPYAIASQTNIPALQGIAVGVSLSWFQADSQSELLKTI